MRQTRTIARYTLTDETVRVHNQNHAHTLRPSCTACSRYGTAHLDYLTASEADDLSKARRSTMGRY